MWVDTVRHRQRVRLRPGVGRSAASSACRRRSTRARSAGAAACRSRTTCTTTSATSPRASTRCASRCSSAASPVASPTCQLRVPRGRRGVGGDRSSSTSRATGRSATSTRSPRSIPRRIDRRAASVELRAKYGAHLLELAAAAATGAPTNMATRAPEDPSTLDESAALAIDTRRGHPRPLRAPLLLRVRGRRSADVDRLQHQGEPVRRPAQGDVRLRHRALGRPRHGRGGRRGVGDGRPRAHHRGRLPRLRVREPGRASSPAATRISSRARRSRPPSPPNWRQQTSHSLVC